MRNRSAVARRPPHGREEVVEQDDVGVDEAAQGWRAIASTRLNASSSRGVPCSLRDNEGMRSAWHASAASAVPSCHRAADLNIVPERFPALECVALDLGDPSHKWLRNGEKRQHYAYRLDDPAER